MNIDEEMSEYEAKISSSFLSRSVDGVMIISFIWRQDKNSGNADEHD